MKMITIILLDSNGKSEFRVSDSVGQEFGLKDGSVIQDEPLYYELLIRQAQYEIELEERKDEDNYLYQVENVNSSYTVIAKNDISALLYVKAVEKSICWSVTQLGIANSSLPVGIVKD